MRRILILGIAFIFAACGRDDVVDPPGTPNPTTISGSYQLTTVDGQNLPFLVFETGDYHARLVAATLNLNTNSSYTFDFNVRIDDTGNIRTNTVSEIGHWNVTRDSITLASSANSFVQKGKVSGNVITLRSNNATLVLRK